MLFVVSVWIGRELDMEFIKRLIGGGNGATQPKVAEKKLRNTKVKETKVMQRVLGASSSKKGGATAERWFDNKEDAQTVRQDEDPFAQAVLCEKKRMEYSHDIYKYLRKVERLFNTREDYLEGKDDLRLGTRYKFVLWLDQESGKFRFGNKQGLKRETVHLTVSLFDRYLELNSENHQIHSKSEMSLIAISCMLIACKHEETSIPLPMIVENSSFDGMYHEHDTILKKEQQILDHLGWRLNHQGPIPFLEVMASEMIFSPQELNFIETMIHYGLLSGISTFFQSSLLAAIFPRIVLLKRGSSSWTIDLLAKTMYTRSQVDQGLTKLRTLLQSDRPKYDNMVVLRKLSSKVSDYLADLPQQ